MNVLEPVIIDLPDTITRPGILADQTISGHNPTLLDVSSGAVAFLMRYPNVNPGAAYAAGFAAVGGVSGATRQADGYLHARYEVCLDTFISMGAANFAGGVSMSVHSSPLPDGTTTVANARATGDWTHEINQFTIPRNYPPASRMIAYSYSATGESIQSEYLHAWKPPHHYRGVEDSTVIIPSVFLSTSEDSLRGQPLVANVSDDTIWLYGGNAHPNQADWPGWYGVRSTKTDQELGNCWTSYDGIPTSVTVTAGSPSIIPINRPEGAILRWVNRTVTTIRGNKIYQRQLMWFRQRSYNQYFSSPNAKVECGVVGIFSYEPERGQNLGMTSWQVPYDWNSTKCVMDGHLLDVADSGLVAVQRTAGARSGEVQFWLQTEQPGNFVPFASMDLTLPVLPPADGRPAPTVSWGVFENVNSSPHRCHLSKTNGRLIPWLAGRIHWNGVDVTPVLLTQRHIPDGTSALSTRDLVMRREWSG